MYSNNIDFGGYDYSGNPNLMRIVKASDFNNESDVSVSDVGYNSIRLTSQGVDRLSAFTSNSIPSLISGKTYTISAKVKVDEGTTGDIDKLRVCYRKTNGGTILLYARSDGAEVGKEITLKGTATVNYEITDLTRFYLSIDMEGATKINGSVIVSDIKIEEGSTATPYQPTLLDDPYWLGKIPLGENIADPAGIISSSYMLLSKQLKEKIIENQTYTITLKGTKPATQAFRCFVEYESGTSAVNLLDMKPVEGLTDEWQLTFKATRTAKGINGDILVYQVPNTSLGQCKIDWFKLEKGDTRTPNISQFKYFGEGLKDSNNPNDYSWDVTPEYTEKGLNNTVSLTEPQSISGVKNFIDGLQVGSKNVATIQEYLYGADFYLGTNHNDAAGVPTKTRMGWGAEVNTVAERLGVPMKPCPLDFNSGRWEATFNRDCRVKLDVLVKVNGMGEKTGHYCYIAYWKDSEQTKQWVESNGLGQNADITNRNVVPMTGIFTAKKGDKLSVAVEIAAGKVVQMQLINAHFQELP